MEDPELLAELLSEIKKNISDVSAERQRDTVKYSFKLNGASMKGFGGGAVKLELKCEQAEKAKAPAESKPEPVKQEPKKEEPKKEEPKKVEPAKKKKPKTPEAKPKDPEPAPKDDEEGSDDASYLQFEPKNSNDSNKDSKPAEDDNKEEPPKEEEEAPKEEAPPILAAATKMEAKPVEEQAHKMNEPPDEGPKLKSKSSSNKSKGKMKRKKSRGGTMDETHDDNKKKKDSTPAKTNASKCVFGTLKMGREKRVHASTQETFDGCLYIPNFKGSERGCVLKKSNDELDKCGIVKKSQLEDINKIDISGEPLKKITKMIGEYNKLGKPFATGFSIPDIELSTIDLTFTGTFCPNVEFVADYEGNNYIIKDIPVIDDNKYLLNKAELKPGYRLIKVKGTSVNNKPFKDTKKMLDKAGKDSRVSYLVTFIESKLDWYNFASPYPASMEEQKIDLPKMKSNKSGSNKSRSKSPRKTPRKRSMNSPIGTPSTPSGKNPKYFLREKKNQTAYFDMRIDGDKRGRIEIVLFAGILPKTCKNFISLCTGDNKKKMTYKGKKFYKMYIGMGLEGGDVENNDGTGKYSIYGGLFKDENFKIRHAQYCLSMKNLDEPDTNASEFYIMTADDAEFLDGKNVVFGYIADKASQELVDDMEEEGCSLTGKPKVKAVISKCGILKKK